MFYLVWNIAEVHRDDIIVSEVQPWQCYGHGTYVRVGQEEEAPVFERTEGQIRQLLIVSGDVERNPGPTDHTSDPLVNGLADLVGKAPPGMRDVLCAWSPDRPSNVIATELSSKKFTMSVLQPALACC